MIQKSYVLFVSILVLFAFSTSSHAQKILEDVKKPMPDIPFLPEEEWLKDTKIYEHNPDAKEEGLNFEIRRPNDREIITDGGMSTFKSDDSVFGEIGRFYGPPR